MLWITFGHRLDLGHLIIFAQNFSPKWIALFMRPQRESAMAFDLDRQISSSARLTTETEIASIAGSSAEVIYFDTPPIAIAWNLIPRVINVHPRQQDSRPISELCTMAVHSYPSDLLSWCHTVMIIGSHGKNMIYLSGQDQRPKKHGFVLLSRCLTINDEATLVTTLDMLQMMFCPWRHKIVMIELVSNVLMSKETELINQLANTTYKVNSNNSSSYYNFKWNGIILISGRSRTVNKADINYDHDINIDRVDKPNIALPPVLVENYIKSQIICESDINEDTLWK